MSLISNHTFLSAAAVTLVFAAISIAYANTRSTRDGVFTAAQAERGRTIYDKSCNSCHQADLLEKLSRFENKSVSQLIESVSTAMPADNPGSLSMSEYVDAFAYIFSITGSPPGSQELTVENMETINVFPIQ